MRIDDGHAALFFARPVACAPLREVEPACPCPADLPHDPCRRHDLRTPPFHRFLAELPAPRRSPDSYEPATSAAPASSWRPAARTEPLGGEPPAPRRAPAEVRQHVRYVIERLLGLGRILDVII
ncbi:MAG: hypothetical protein SFY69_03590 [Planctomycetota bacterium]|nr:hypothetical protein [Planctomycetota bacterium]